MTEKIKSLRKCFVSMLAIVILFGGINFTSAAESSKSDSKTKSSDSVSKSKPKSSDSNSKKKSSKSKSGSKMGGSTRRRSK